MAVPRITIDPSQMGGAPCIRGLRIPVSSILESMAEGVGFDQVLEAYPDLEVEDLHACLRLAAEKVQEPARLHRRAE